MPPKKGGKRESQKDKKKRQSVIVVKDDNNSIPNTPVKAEKKEVPAEEENSLMDKATNVVKNVIKNVLNSSSDSDAEPEDVNLVKTNDTEKKTKPDLLEKSEDTEKEAKKSEDIEKEAIPEHQEPHIVDDWQQTLIQMKPGGFLEEDFLNENFTEVKSKHIDHDRGFGYISEFMDRPSVKVILRETSPFFNDVTRMKNFLLEKFHFYSLGFRVFKKLKILESGRTVYLFRHFLDLPSLSTEQVQSVRVVASSSKDASFQEVEFLKPLWIDTQYICVEQKNYSWFQVVSDIDHLPIRMNLVPFRLNNRSHSTIFICPLPRGRQHIQKMLQENPGWKKCGYEEPCVLNKGINYQFFDQDGTDASPCGWIKTETRSEDTLWVKYGTEKWKNQAFVPVILRQNQHEDQVFSGQISLYDCLRVDEDLSVYEKTRQVSWDLAKIDPGMLADLPFPGSVTHVDPFLQYVRQGRLSVTQLRAISTHMGFKREEKYFEDMDIATIFKIVMENWKEEQGRGASLVKFMTILKMADVSLSAIAMEIYQNITNSQWI